MLIVPAAFWKKNDASAGMRAEGKSRPGKKYSRVSTHGYQNKVSLATMKMVIASVSHNGSYCVRIMSGRGATRREGYVE